MLKLGYIFFYSSILKNSNDANINLLKLITIIIIIIIQTLLMNKIIYLFKSIIWKTNIIFDQQEKINKIIF